jgi:hypothetical protein
MDWEPTACDLANYSADFLASYSAILGELFRNFDSVETLLTRTGSIFPRLHEGGNGHKVSRNNLPKACETNYQVITSLINASTAAACSPFSLNWIAS